MISVVINTKETLTQAAAKESSRHVGVKCWLLTERLFDKWIKFYTFELRNNSSTIEVGYSLHENAIVRHM